ncbi:MAG: dTDP-glucose 4,6-dehydratase [Deltaproteobacteria bacterium]|nr:MAG: dTDP-glucose 4,6-dehydratase [Deltaproteobacteria bacterium]
MRILVTGGAGFIGSNFLTRYVLRHPEHDFINVDKLTYAANPHSLTKVALKPNYTFVHADIVDAERIDAIFEEYRPDAVVHFAAESHVDRSILDPRDFLRTNVEGTFNLLQACRRIWKRDEGFFHHVSTDEVYGSLGAEGLFTEDSPYDPSSPYSACKAASDHLVRAWHRTYGLPVKITNCSNNYGPRQFPEKLIPLMITRCLEGRPLPIYGNGTNVRDWLYVDDHSDAIWAVMERGRVGETYNIGGNSEQRNIDVVERVCELVAREAGIPESQLTSLITYVPDRPGHDARYAVDASKLRDECGWEPTETFTTGLEKTVRWYLGNQEWVNQVTTGEYREWVSRRYPEAAKTV